MTFLYVRILGAVIAVAALLFGWHEITHHYDKQGYDRRAAEDKTAADQQAERNRDLQRQAEKRYTVQAETRDRFITLTTKEVVHEAAPLASCDVPEPVRLHLNAAADCARGDSPGSCGSGNDLPSAR